MVTTGGHFVNPDQGRVAASIGKVQFLTQNRIHAFHLIADNFFRRVPDPEFLAQLRIERMQEGFIKILHRVAFVEGLEKNRAIHAI